MSLTYEERKALTLYLRNNDTGIGEAILRLGLQADMRELWNAADGAGFLRCLDCGRWRYEDQIAKERDVCKECEQQQTKK